jgi:hypothetical protein
MSGEFDASELLKELDDLDKAFQSFDWLFSSPTAMIRMVLIISLLIFAVWRKCCTKSSDTPAFPAPSAPTAPISAQTPMQPTAIGMQPASLNF